MLTPFNLILTNEWWFPFGLHLFFFLVTLWLNGQPQVSKFQHKYFLQICPYYNFYWQISDVLDNFSSLQIEGESQILNMCSCNHLFLFKFLKMSNAKQQVSFPIIYTINGPYWRTSEYVDTAIQIRMSTMKYRI